MTTDHTTHPLARTSKSLVFNTAIFTLSNSHLYLIQWPSSGSAQGADIWKVHGYPLIPYFPHSIPGLLQGQIYSKFKIYPQTHFSNAPQDHQKFHCQTWSQLCSDKSSQCRRASWNTCQGCLKGPEPSPRPRHHWKRKNGKDIKERGKEEDCWRNSCQGGDCHLLHWGVPCLQATDTLNEDVTIPHQKIKGQYQSILEHSSQTLPSYHRTQVNGGKSEPRHEKKE